MVEIIDDTILEAPVLLIKKASVKSHTKARTQSNYQNEPQRFDVLAGRTRRTPTNPHLTQIAVKSGICVGGNGCSTIAMGAGNVRVLMLMAVCEAVHWLQCRDACNVEIERHEERRAAESLR